MRSHLCLLFFSILIPSISRAKVDISLQGIKDDLKNNAEVVIASTVPNTESTIINIRLKRQITEAVKQGLRAKGYYHPIVTFEVPRQNSSTRQAIIVHVDVGEPVRIQSNNVTISGEGAYDRDYVLLVQRNLPKQGDILNHGSYDTFRNDLQNLAIYKGYFDAVLRTNQLAVAPQLNQGFWNIDFDTGVRYRFGKTTFQGSQIDLGYLESLIPYDENDPFSADLLSEFNRRLSSTNWFESIVPAPEFSAENSQRKVLPINVSLTPRSRNIIELGGGFSTDIGPRITTSWTKPWLNRYGQSLDFNTSLSKPEQSVDFSYNIPLRKAPLEQYYQVQAGLKREDQNDTKSNTSSVSVARNWVSTTTWRRTVNLQWSKERFTQGITTGTTSLLYPGLSISRTRQRGGVNTVWGDSQRYSIDVSNTAWGSDIDFIIFQAQTAWIRTFNDKHRFVTRFNFGYIKTDSFNRVPSSLRFFAGGDRSVRGYKYKAISPVDSNGQLTGAPRIATGSLEYQYNVSGPWWGAVFFDVGEAVHRFNSSDLKKGTGMGVRWISPVGPIKLDIARAIGDPSKSGIEFYIGLGSGL